MGPSFHKTCILAHFVGIFGLFWVVLEAVLANFGPFSPISEALLPILDYFQYFVAILVGFGGIFGQFRAIFGYSWCLRI